jgi:hypothetical protein
LSTPAGNPACSASCASSSEVSGASSGGLRTTAHPAASAGAIFQEPIIVGEFHGVIAATTPIGCRTV